MGININTPWYVVSHQKALALVKAVGRGLPPRNYGCWCNICYLENNDGVWTTSEDVSKIKLKRAVALK